MMKTRNKLNRGGIDTIVAYIVVMIPLVYVLIFMVATIYHYAVQMSINQTVKETLVMASSYGTVTPSMLDDYLGPQVSTVTKSSFNAQFYVRTLTEDGTITSPEPAVLTTNGKVFDVTCNGNKLKKGDLLGLRIWTNDPSVLGTVSAFSMFGSTANDKSLYYSSYREEIIRNEYDPQ